MKNIRVYIIRKYFYTFVHLTTEYKTMLNIETSCGDTVQLSINYGNLIKIVDYIHIAYYSLSSTFPNGSRPATQI